MGAHVSDLSADNDSRAQTSLPTWMPAQQTCLPEAGALCSRIPLCARDKAITGWLRSPKALEPGTAMPTLGLWEQDARDVSVQRQQSQPAVAEQPADCGGKGQHRQFRQRPGLCSLHREYLFRLATRPEPLWTRHTCASQSQRRIRRSDHLWNRQRPHGRKGDRGNCRVWRRPGALQRQGANSRRAWREWRYLLHRSRDCLETAARTKTRRCAHGPVARAQRQYDPGYPQRRQSQRLRPPDLQRRPASRAHHQDAVAAIPYRAEKLTLTVQASLHWSASQPKTKKAAQTTEWARERLVGREDLNLRTPWSRTKSRSQSKCFIWRRLGAGKPLVSRLNCTEFVPRWRPQSGKSVLTAAKMLLYLLPPRLV